jgi:hypothetical protein
VAGDVPEDYYVQNYAHKHLEQGRQSSDTAVDEVGASHAETQRQVAYNPSACDPTEPLPLSANEARLLRNFTDRMALWTDVADPYHNFQTTVSRLALTDPIIRSAICAFSARHLYRCQESEDDDAEALYHQNQCLNLLIPSMSGSHRITASVLVAVALLRQNEEMDGKSGFFSSLQ